MLILKSMILKINVILLLKAYKELITFCFLNFFEITIDFFEKIQYNILVISPE